MSLIACPDCGRPGLTCMCSMLAEYYPRGADGKLYLPTPPPLPDFMTLKKSNGRRVWIVPVKGGR